MAETGPKIGKNNAPSVEKDYDTESLNEILESLSDEQKNAVLGWLDKNVSNFSRPTSEAETKANINNHVDGHVEGLKGDDAGDNYDYNNAPWMTAYSIESSDNPSASSPSPERKTLKAEEAKARNDVYRQNMLELSKKVTIDGLSSTGSKELIEAIANNASDDELRNIWNKHVPDDQKWRDLLHPDDPVRQQMDSLRTLSEAAPITSRDKLVNVHKGLGYTIRVYQLGGDAAQSVKKTESSDEWNRTKSLSHNEKTDNGGNGQVGKPEHDGKNEKRFSKLSRKLKAGALAAAVIATTTVGVVGSAPSGVQASSRLRNSEKTTETSNGFGNQEDVNMRLIDANGNLVEAFAKIAESVDEQVEELESLGGVELRTYDADSLPAIDRHMWGHDYDGDNIFDTSFKVSPTAFSGEVNTESKKTVYDHTMESCESMPEQAAIIASIVAPEMMDGWNASDDINIFADQITNNNELRADVLNAISDKLAHSDFDVITFGDGTMVTNYGISRLADGVNYQLSSNVSNVGGRQAVELITQDDNALYFLVDCCNVIMMIGDSAEELAEEVEDVQEPEVVEETEEPEQTIDKTTTDTGEPTGDEDEPSQETTEEEEEEEEKEEEEEEEEEKETLEEKELSSININHDNEDKVKVDMKPGNVNNSTGTTEQQKIDKSPNIVEGGVAQESGSTDEPAPAADTAQPAAAEQIVSDTTVTAGNEQTVVDSGYQVDGTVQNAGVVESTPSAEVHEEAVEEAVTIDDIENVVNSGTIELAP